MKHIKELFPLGWEIYKIETMEINKLIRNSLRDLIPYSSARDDFEGTASVFMDANESPFETNIYCDLLDVSLSDGQEGTAPAKISCMSLNRYPDPLQKDLKNKISELNSVSVNNIFMGNGSDEIIDLLLRAFCEPGKDEIIILPPTYGMYRVIADIQNVNVREVRLTGDYQPDISGISKSACLGSKLLFICSPNNPTGNIVLKEVVEELLNLFPGIIVVDEAYIDFAEDKTVLPLLRKYQNLVVLHTFSKAWGLAGIRLGVGYADQSIIEVLNRIKMPYNVNELTQRIALKALEQPMRKQIHIKTILSEKVNMVNDLKKLDLVKSVYPSDANFLLVKVRNAKLVYKYLVENGIVVRDRSDIPGCEECLRITVGTHMENQKLLIFLKEIANLPGPGSARKE